jgi:hypothetical protein
LVNPWICQKAGANGLFSGANEKKTVLNKYKIYTTF